MGRYGVSLMEKGVRKRKMPDFGDAVVRRLVSGAATYREP